MAQKNGRTLYLECSSGISGDMFVAAMLDLGADQNKLESVLKTLPLDGYKIHISKVIKSAIQACDFDVILDEDNHDHDMEYLHGHEKPAGGHGEAYVDHEHSHDREEHEHLHDGQEHDHDDHGHDYDGHRHDHDGHGHDHDGHGHDHDGHDHYHDEQGHVHYYDDHDEHDHDHHDDHGSLEHTHSHENHAHPHDGHIHPHSHVHRGLKEIREILCGGGMSENALALTLKIFSIIAEAESKAHGLPAEEVHFHEVGAVDSIIDVAAAAICLDDLDITEVIIPSLTEGTGTVRCQHGILPVPVPAVSNIAAAHSLPLKISNVRGELVTPTGAAIAAAIRTSGTLPEDFSIEKIGIGAGKRKYECPGLLRAMLVRKEDETGTEKDSITVLETNIDDSTGEELGFLMDLLLKAGARDVYYTPIFMKKNRPAVLLRVICKEDNREALEQLIFENSTTIGIRRQKMERTILPRREAFVSSPWGEMRVKVCTINGREVCYPEYDSVTEIAARTGCSYRDIYQVLRNSPLV